MEYLDKTGLAYLWGKIKGKLNNKADKSSLDTVIEEVSSLSKNTAIDKYIAYWYEKPFYFYKYGHIVVMTSPSDIPAGRTLPGGYTTITTVPKGFRPPVQVYGFCGDNVVSEIRIQANADGTIQVYTPTNLPGPYNAGLTCIYFVE